MVLEALRSKSSLTCYHFSDSFTLVTVQYCKDNGTTGFFTQKVVVKINRKKHMKLLRVPKMGIVPFCCLFSLLNWFCFLPFSKLGIGAWPFALWTITSVVGANCVVIPLSFSCGRFLQLCLTLCFKFQAPSIICQTFLPECMPIKTVCLKIKVILNQLTY